MMLGVAHNEEPQQYQRHIVSGTICVQPIGLELIQLMQLNLSW